MCFQHAKLRDAFLEYGWPDLFRERKFFEQVDEMRERWQEEWRRANQEPDFGGDEVAAFAYLMR